MANILVVEDNIDLAFGLTINLEQDGYTTTVVHSGHDAIQAIHSERIDLVILDLMLPDIPGFDVLSRLRADGLTVPVLILSARAEEHIRIAAFRHGADDYVTKPFSLPELLERVKARLRNSGSIASPGGITVDRDRHRVTVNGTALRLAPKEFELLCELIRANGAVVSYGQLLESVWKLPADWKTRTAITHVGNLRRKLKDVGLAHAIRTVPKHGVAWMLGTCFV